MKGKITKKFNILLLIAAFVISFNITIIAFNAQQSSAEAPIIIPDENVEVEVNTKEVQNFTNAIECYIYAEAAMLSGTCYSTITGSVKGYNPLNNEVLLHQTMDNTRIFDNDGYRYSTSLSLQRGSIGRDNCQKVMFDTSKPDGKVYKMSSTKTVNGQPDFSGSKWEVYTQDEYCNASGNLPGTMMYIVRESTVKKVELFEKLEDGSYHLKLLLDNVKSVKNYKKLVKTSAGSFATDYPKFTTVRVEAKIDKYGNFIEHIMQDEAKIGMGIGIVSIDCKMVSYYVETFHTLGGNVETPFERPNLV